MRAESWPATGRSWASSAPTPAWSRFRVSDAGRRPYGASPAGHRRLPRGAVTQRSADERHQRPERHGGARCSRGIVLVLALVRSPAHEPASGTDPDGWHPVVRSDAGRADLERASECAHRAPHAHAPCARARLRRVRARAVSEDAGAVARHARVRARTAAGHRQRAHREHPEPGLPHRPVLRVPFEPQADSPLLRRHRAPHGHARELRPGVGAADLQDRPPPRDRLRAHRGVSLHSRVGVCGVQRRLALHRHRVLARLFIGDLQHHRRLHDDLPARVQSRGLGEGRCGLWRGHRNASASHASAFDEERRDRHPQLANPRERGASTTVRSPGRGD